MNTNSSREDMPSISVPIQSKFIFFIFLFLDIPSVLCSLILFYYFARLPEYHREKYSNHTVYYLLIGTLLVTSIDIPLILPYLQKHFYVYSLKYPIVFCMFWTTLDFGMYSVNLWLMALACLERYLRIFFKRILMKTRIRRVFLYYILATFAFVYPISWYMFPVIFFPCDRNLYDFTQIVCGNPCVLYDAGDFLVNLSWILADLLPLLLSISFLLLLIIHVFYQKHKMKKRLLRQQIWKRTRKMFLQLFPMIWIFLIFNMPLILVGFLATYNPWFNTTPYFYTNALSYGLPLCMPFAILSKQTPIKRRLAILLRLIRFNQIIPATTAALPLRLRHEQMIGRMRTNNGVGIDS